VCPDRRVSIAPVLTISPSDCVLGADFVADIGTSAAMAAIVAAKTEKALLRRAANEYSISSPPCTGCSLGVVRLPVQFSPIQDG